MKRLTLRLAIFSAILFASVPAHATSLIIDLNGILLGATNVPVGEKFYDVAFIDGTCTQVYGVCDLAHFAFTTESESLAASKALLDYVFLDIPGLGNFDSDPMLTNGCAFPFNCWVLTPYQIMGSNFLVTQSLNSTTGTSASQGPDGYFVHQPNGPGLSIFGTATENIYDASTDYNGVLAKWTLVPTASPVPEPTAFCLVAVGLAGIECIRRKRK